MRFTEQKEVVYAINHLIADENSQTKKILRLVCE